MRRHEGKWKIQNCTAREGKWKIQKCNVREGKWKIQKRIVREVKWKRQFWKPPKHLWNFSKTPKYL